MTSNYSTLTHQPYNELQQLKYLNAWEVGKIRSCEFRKIPQNQAKSTDIRFILFATLNTILNFDRRLQAVVISEKYSKVGS